VSPTTISEPIVVTPFQYRELWLASVIRSRELTPGEKITATALAMHLNLGTGQLNPSARCLAADTNQSERNVQRHIKKLLAMALIAAKRTAGRVSNSYELIHRPDTTSGTGLAVARADGDAAATTTSGTGLAVARADGDAAATTTSGTGLAVARADGDAAATTTSGTGFKIQPRQIAHPTPTNGDVNPGLGVVRTSYNMKNKRAREAHGASQAAPSAPARHPRRLSTEAEQALRNGRVAWKPRVIEEWFFPCEIEIVAGEAVVTAPTDWHGKWISDEHSEKVAQCFSVRSCIVKRRRPAEAAA